MPPEEIAAPSTPAAAAPEVVDIVKVALETAEKDAPLEVAEPAEPEKEAVKPAPAVEEKESGEPDLVSQRLAEVVRADRAVKRERTEFRREQEAAAAIREKAKAFDTREAELQRMAKEDPWGMLAKYGVDFVDALGRYDAKPDAKPVDPEVKALRERLEKLEQDRTAEREAATKQQAQQTEQQVYRGMLKDISSVISSKPDDYEAILDDSKGPERVFSALDAMYREICEQTGRDPGPPGPDDIAAAATIVEQALRQQELEELRSKQGRKRFAGRLTLGEPVTAAAPRATTPAASPSRPTTITNSLQGDAPQRKRPGTDEERLAAALAIPLPFEPLKQG
jgi:hypothetical protein